MITKNTFKKLQHETKEYRLNNNLLELKFNYNDNLIIYTIVREYASMRVCEYASTRVCEYPSMQVGV